MKAALKFDWTPNVPELRDAWMKGGTLTIKKIYPDAKTGQYDYRGHQGQQDRMGNGADGRAVRRGRLDARRLPASR